MGWSFGDRLRSAMKLDCADKVRYPSYEEALKTAKIRTAPGARNHAKFLQPYPCDKGCQGFHLTSRPFRDKVDQYPVIGEWQP